MLSLFRRRKGRHQLGAAVTSIPSLAPAVPAPVQASTPEPVAPPLPAAPPPPSAEAPVATAPPTVPAAPAAPAAPAVEAVRVPMAPVPEHVMAGPRVELGFRDGTRASLDPSSEQARALDELAAVLTRKD